MASTESTQRAFEEAGRKRKMLALIAAIDRHARASGLDPLSRAFADELPSMTAQWWMRAATSAAVHPPSEVTIGAVSAFYRSRAEQLVAQRVPAGA